MLIFLLMNSVVIASSLLLACKVFKFNLSIDYLITLFILYLAQIIATELFLGIFGILYLKNLILLNAGLLFLIWFTTRNKKFTCSFTGIKDALTQLFSDKVILLATAVILGFALVKVGINLVNPPFGWDNLNYHFTSPVEWLKHANLDNPITINDDPGPAYYPINGSLFFLWLIFPFKNVFLADLGQIPFFILAFLSVISIGIKLGLNRENSCLAACLFTLIPNYFKQMEIAYVDVMVAALFLAGLNFLLLLNKEASLKNVLIYNLTLGLFLGTKTVALPYAILLFIPLIYLYFNKRYAQFLLLSLAIVIIFGGFSYIRNFIQTGNPLYPLDLKLFAKTIFKGAIDYQTYRAHFKTEDYALGKLLFHEGLGLQSLILILPSIFLALPVSFVKNKKALNFSLLYFLILPLLLYLVYRFVIPLANTRYLYPLLGIGIILGFYTVHILGTPKIILKILVVISILASAFELANHLELISSIILTFLLFFLGFLFLKNIQKVKFKIRPSFLAYPLIISLLILAILEKDYTRNEFPRYITMQKYSGFWPDATSAWDWLNKNTSGNNIAYVGRPVPFPLYGTNFKNNIYYVSVNKIEPAKLHFFPGSHYTWGYDFLSLHKNLEAKGNYRSGADYLIWLNNLLKRNTAYLFVYSLHQTKDIAFPLEDKWAGYNPSKFVPVFSNKTIHIYKVLP